MFSDFILNFRYLFFINPSEPGFEGENGVVVSAVEPGSSAAQDVKEGDLIKEVNREKINNIKEFREALKSAEEGKDILLLIRRGMHTRFVIIKGKIE